MLGDPEIRLVLLDIDGVVTEGEARPLDLGLLRDLAALNRAAREDPGRPAVTLCTGRPAPYLEVMLQAIDGHLPGIFENGAGLYLPQGYRFVPHPDLPPDGIAEVRRRLEAGPVRAGRAYFQPGKEYTLTLFATDPADTPRLGEWARQALGDLAERVDLVFSTSCLNILPRGVDKGRGVEFLAQTVGCPPAAMLGVGDSDVDLPFLERVGHPAAPANANPEVKARAEYVSPYPTSQGVRDILRHYGVMP